MKNTTAVLVVDDDPDVLLAARLALTGDVERVDTESSVDGLDRRLTAMSYDVALVDMNFVAGCRDGQQGLDTLDSILEIDPTLSVVLMTAYGGVTLAVEALKRGATDFVLKPWRNDKLVAAVVAAANLTRGRRSAQTLELDALEKQAIERALARHERNITLAAAALGLSRAALYRRMAKHGL
jgi:two-component system response regulator RegA